MRVPMMLPPKRTGIPGLTPVEFNAQSKARLSQVNPTLAELMLRVEAQHPDAFEISEGMRDGQRQAQMVAEGKSQTLNSKHLTGNAVDIAMIGPDGQPNWTFDDYRPIAATAKATAASLGIPDFVWGGDWKTLRDGVHFQVGGPQAGGPANNLTVSSKGGAPMGLLDMRAEQAPQTFGQRIKSGFQDGSLFDSMAMAFNGLRMNPDENLGQVVGQRQEMRQQEDVMNRTVAWLQSMGTPQAMQAAEALATGSIDAGSAVQYALAKPEDNRTALQQNIEYMMQTQNMSFDDAMRAVQGASGGTSISLGSNGIEYGDAPKDMAWARNTDGTVKLDDRGIPVAMPIQATKLATEADAAAAAAAQKAQNAGVYGDAAIMAIDQLIGGPGQAGMINDGAGVFNVSNVGIVGDRLAKMGLSQSAVDVKNTLETVTSNIAFGRLQAMRDASVTGGALGSVTENELNMLMNSLGAVKPDTSPELLRTNLATIRSIWTKINSDPVARSFYYGAGGQSGAPAAGGTAGDGFTVTGQF